MNVWLGHEAGPALNVKYLEEDWYLGCKDRNFAQVRWLPGSKVCCEFFLTFDYKYRVACDTALITTTCQLAFSDILSLDKSLVSVLCPFLVCKVENTSV